MTTLHALHGAEGFVSIEVAGTVAHDLAASLRSAPWLHNRIAPATSS